MLTENDSEAITELLLGRKVEKVDDKTLRLDNGTKLTFEGNVGQCACDAGCYDLTELNGVDNIITKVELVNDPDGDYFPDAAAGVYKIFVFAGNERINLATFEGTDGNGYYGTGYSIEVQVA